MLKSSYIGRFAPSPTGLLHLGSIMTAIVSYCDAKHNKGQWLVRIEDLDPPREISGASAEIINSLNLCGFEFNQDVIYQSQIDQQKSYTKAITVLEELSLVYYCSCSRQDLKKTSTQSHACRNNLQLPEPNYSSKIKVADKSISFNDNIQGHYQKNLLSSCGDFVIKRKDGLIAYQLAVVVDDFKQGITHIVRGIDLLDSTPWQIYLNSLLGYSQPQYSHLPILVNSQGQKLSKQTFAKEIDLNNPLKELLKAYGYLNQTPFQQKPKTIDQFWQYAISNWNINKIVNMGSIAV